MRLSLFILFTLWISDLTSQETFVTFIENEDSELSVYDIIYDEEMECYFTLGNKIDSLNGLWLAKFNKDGELVDQNYYYGDTLYNFQLEQKNKLIKIENGIYFTSGILAFSQSQQYEMFFDGDLDIISYRETSPFIEGLTKFNFSSLKYGDDIILTGTKQKNNFEIDTYLKRINQNGEEIWETEIGEDDELNDRYSSVTVFDTLIIVGTTTRILGSSTTAKSQCHISFIDAEDGEVIHELDLNLSQSSNSGPTDVIPFEREGETLLAFGSREGTYNEDYFEFRSQIRYFITDLEGNVKDSIRLGNDLSVSNGLFYNAKTEVGFVSSGNLLINDTYRALVVGMFDERADTIWWSKYDFNDSEEYAEYYNITGQEVLPDGSIVLCGNLAELEFTTFQPVRERPFILKLDADGCLDPGCREGVNVNSILIKNFYDISPNPSNGRFEIQGKYEDLQLLDAYGNKIYHSSTLNGNATVVEVPSFSTGIYYFNVTKRGDSETKKIILINN